MKNCDRNLAWAFHSLILNFIFGPLRFLIEGNKLLKIIMVIKPNLIKDKAQREKKVFCFSYFIFHISRKFAQEFEELEVPWKTYLKA